jgi:ABC-type branched-subunit amino acid transport system ATPase component
VILGGLYALVAIGFNLQYGMARIVNLAYGAFLMGAAFAAFWMFTLFSINPILGMILTVPATFGVFTRDARAAAPARMAHVFELFPRLAERRRQAVRTMSGGEQQMVAVGRALMTRPSLLLLDEPSLGLAPLLAAELFGALARVARESDTAILMVEQNARRALKMANRAYLLSLGRIVGEGSAQSLAQDKAVAESYLGL